jgi:hypothetical protein
VVARIYFLLRQSWFAAILNKSFCGGVQGGQFFQKAPPLVAKNSKIVYTGAFGGSKNEKKHFLANYFFSCISNWINTIMQKESTRRFGVN